MVSWVAARMRGRAEFLFGRETKQEMKGRYIKVDGFDVVALTFGSALFFHVPDVCSFMVTNPDNPGSHADEVKEIEVFENEKIEDLLKRIYNDESSSSSG
jgi:hypothetical protein